LGSDLPGDAGTLRNHSALRRETKAESERGERREAECRAANPMPMTVRHERDNVYRLEVVGTLHKLELERCQQVLIAEIGRIGAIRLLFLLDGFEGWEPLDDWHDLSFYVKHGGAIERIAMVGEERWRSQSLMFAGADLRRAPVEYFSPDKAADARVWLST
jgi:SpoIIAA-like